VPGRLGPRGITRPSWAARHERVCTSAYQTIRRSEKMKKRGRPGRRPKSAPALAGAPPWRARGAEPHSSSQTKEADAPAETTRGSRDRLKGKPQERQNSAPQAGRGTASGERLKSDFATYWYQFCYRDIDSMLRMSIHGVRMFTEQVSCRGRHVQESEEVKEDREGSHQEGGKEDLKEKEVIVSATEKSSPPGRNPDAKRNLSKGSEMSFAAVRYRGKAL
jgi:hypothetical protein